MPFVSLRVAALCLLVLSAPALAEKRIYACKDAAGNAIFSSQPCGPDAKELHVDAGRPVSAVMPVDGARDGGPAGEGKAPPSAVQDIADSVADSTCRNEARRKQVHVSEDHLQELEAQRQALIKSLAGAPAGADADAQSRGLDFQIDEERRRVTLANEKAERDYRDALAECDRKKADRVQQQAGQ